MSILQTFFNPLLRILGIACMLWGVLAGASMASPPAGHPLESIPIPSDHVIKKQNDLKRYFGVLKTPEELKALWQQMEVLTDPPAIFLSPSTEDAPSVDFDRFDVIWFWDRGAQASFVESATLRNKDSGREVVFRVVHSDFGSRHLRLWSIPKSSEPIGFREVHLYDRGP